MVINKLLNEFDEKVIGLFVKENSDYYLQKWKFMADSGSKISWNWAAAIFGWFNQSWFFYRKMFLYGLGFYVVLFFLFPLIAVIGVFLGDIFGRFGFDEEMSRLIVMLTVIVWQFVKIIFFGFFGNYLYGRFVYNKLTKFRLSSKDDEEFFRMAAEKGGTSVTFVFFGFLMEFLLLFFLGKFIYLILSSIPGLIF
ncbi:DUF2628 domain-containing protein [Desulfurobacterium sp.]